MSVAEAWETLGIPPGSDKRAIITAHKKLMSKLHPDKGGSNFLASRVNQAKDRLMDELKKQGGANE
jgi:DnaJ-class molecular chaperone